MPTPLLDDAAKLAQAAELLRRSADAMHDRRSELLAAGQLTTKQFRANVVAETELRGEVSEIVLAALKKVVKGATGSQEDLEGAIDDANAKIKTIDDIKKTLAIFASLIGLATAIATMRPAPIVAALKGLQAAAGG